MIYLLYCSSGNTIGVDEYVGYSEIDADGYWHRYVEIKADGSALRYSRDHAADVYGVLPEGMWDAVEASNPKYGTVTPISESLFEAVWNATRCKNETK